MSDFHNFLELWRELFRVERKVAASEMGVSPAQYGRIESGQTPLSAERLRALGRVSNSSLNTLLLAFMLMDDNVERIESDDPGDQLILWLHQRLAAEARRNETHSTARHFLGYPQSLKNIISELNLPDGEYSADEPATAPHRRAAASL
ncbi:hypothetical protein CW354_20405 [Marinicaulis flavus]|uniref:HTH cro/C1-type domain-containing protein n=1 Tax=Hyphococcus luteus TaxID=2058213 RepID=A0A2S7K069_9PROT|nr:hypothetical protein CW354_20405 [Marinicaulis flavus]